MAWRRSESQRGVEKIYVLTLFLPASSFFVLLKGYSQGGVSSEK
jgi:hypothetical protein